MSFCHIINYTFYNCRVLRSLWGVRTSYINVCQSWVTRQTYINQTLPTLRNNFRLKPTSSLRGCDCLSFSRVLFMTSAKSPTKTHTNITEPFRQTFDKCIDNMTSVRKFTIAFYLILGNCCSSWFGALCCILICGL